MFKIFVGNISFETTEEQLRRIFEPHIEIEDLVIAREADSGKSKGYGFVMTRDPIRGRRAIFQIGKFFIDGRLAYIKEARNKKNQPAKRPARRVSHRPKPFRGRRSDVGSAAPRPSSNGNGAAGSNGGGPGGVSRGYVGMEEDAPRPVTPPPGNARRD
ncbi:MAG: hypothetical protein WD294_10910 [Phycisphaeraceae bacterium]